MKRINPLSVPGRRLIAGATVCVLALAGLSCGGSGDTTQPGNLPTLSALRLLDDSVMFAVGDSLDVPFSGVRSDGAAAAVTDVRWDSRNASVVKVVEPDRLAGVGAGRTWVVASNHALADSMLVIVRTMLPVDLSSHLDTLASIGDTLPLSATVAGGMPAPASVTWGSRDSTVVRVTQSGLAIAVGEGTAYVLALEDHGGRDSDRVVVRQRLVRIDVTPAVDSVRMLRPVRLTARAVDARDMTIARLTVGWTLRNESLARVDSTGLVTALGVGLDTLDLSVPGLTRALPLTVAPAPPLRFNRDTIFVGVGQLPNAYSAQLPLIIGDAYSTGRALPITFTAADSTVAVMPLPVSLGVEGPMPDSITTAVPFGRRIGTTVVTATAAGYGPGTVVVRVTRPRLAMADSLTPQFDSTQPTVKVTTSAAFQDSLGHDGQLWTPVAVSFRTSDSAVVVPTAPYVVVDSGQIGAPVGMRPTGIGTAWLIAKPGSDTPDSTLVHVTVYQARLRFVNEPGFDPLVRTSPMYLGVGQSTTFDEVGVYATAHGGWNTHVAATLSHGSGSIIAIPDSASLDAGYFHVQGLAQGRDTIVATAAGYAPDSLIVIVTRPSFRFNFAGSAYSMIGNAATFPTTTVFHEVSTQAIYTDSSGLEKRGPFIGDWYVARLTSTDTTVLRPVRDSVIFTGGSTDGTDILSVAVGAGTARLVLSDPAGRAIPDTSIAITVAPAPVHLRYAGAVAAGGGVTLGFRQTLLDTEHVYVDGPADFQYSAPVSLHSTNDSIVRPTASIAHADNLGVPDSHFDLLAGTEAGTAWIVVDGPGIRPDSLPVTVGRPQLQLVSPPAQDSTRFGFALRITDQAGLIRRTLDSLTFDLQSTNWSVLGVSPASLDIPPMATTSPSSAFIHFNGEGTAAVRITDSRSVPYTYEPTATRFITVDSLLQPVTQLWPDSLQIRRP